MSLETQLELLNKNLEALNTNLAILAGKELHDAAKKVKEEVSSTMSATVKPAGVLKAAMEKQEEQEEKPKAKSKRTSKKKEVENDQDMIDTALTEPDEESTSYTVEDCKSISRTKMQEGVDRKKIKQAIKDAGGDSLADLSEEQIQAAYKGIESL